MYAQISMGIMGHNTADEIRAHKDQIKRNRAQRRLRTRWLREQRVQEREGAELRRLARLEHLEAHGSTAIASRAALEKQELLKHRREEQLRARHRLAQNKARRRAGRARGKRDQAAKAAGTVSQTSLVDALLSNRRGAPSARAVPVQVTRRSSRRPSHRSTGRSTQRSGPPTQRSEVSDLSLMSDELSDDDLFSPLSSSRSRSHSRLTASLPSLNLDPVRQAQEDRRRRRKEPQYHDPRAYKPPAYGKKRIDRYAPPDEGLMALEVEQLPQDMHADERMRSAFHEAFGVKKLEPVVLRHARNETHVDPNQRFEGESSLKQAFVEHAEVAVRTPTKRSPFAQSLPREERPRFEGTSSLKDTFQPLPLESFRRNPRFKPQPDEYQRSADDRDWRTTNSAVAPPVGDYRVPREAARKHLVDHLNEGGPKKLFVWRRSADDFASPKVELPVPQEEEQGQGQGQGKGQEEQGQQRNESKPGAGSRPGSSRSAASSRMSFRERDFHSSRTLLG